MDPLWSETCWSTFKYFIILIVSTYYILCICWVINCLITTPLMLTIITGVFRCCLSWASWIQTTPSYRVFFNLDVSAFQKADLVSLMNGVKQQGGRQGKRSGNCQNLAAVIHTGWRKSRWTLEAIYVYIEVSGDSWAILCISYGNDRIRPWHVCFSVEWFEGLRIRGFMKLSNPSNWDVYVSRLAWEP